MKKISFPIIAFLISIIIIFIVEFLMEFLIEESLKDSPAKNLIIPIAVLFGLVTNIAILLNFDIVNKIPKIEHLLALINKQSKTSERLLENLKNEDKKIREIFLHLNSRDHRVKEFGSTLVNKYLNGFELRKNGFHLVGEYWALKTYVNFWSFLAAEQEKRKKEGNQQFIIARITHSNDIGIWKEDYKAYQPFSHELYLFQKKFMENGGKVIRMLIGPHPTPNEDYQAVIEKMGNIGIEVKYFHDKEVMERDFDFLFLADENIVLKWFSGATGRRLAGCTIEDKIEDVVIKTWASLFEKTKEMGDPVNSIPPDREFHI